MYTYDVSLGPEFFFMMIGFIVMIIVIWYIVDWFITRRDQKRTKRKLKL